MNDYDCKTCERKCVYPGVSVCPGWVKREYRISPERINTLFLSDKQTGDKLLKEWYPDEFKPKQEYCCNIFHQAFSDGSIIYANKNGVNGWAFQSSGYWIDYCFRCGKPPIPPIST